jgi:hypothetical protein
MTCSMHPFQLLQRPCGSRQLTQQLHRCVSQKEVSQMRMSLQRALPACVTKRACVAHTQQQWLLVRCVLECVHYTCSCSASAAVPVGPHVLLQPRLRPPEPSNAASASPTCHQMCPYGAKHAVMLSYTCTRHDVSLPQYTASRMSPLACGCCLGFACFCRRTTAAALLALASATVPPPPANVTRGMLQLLYP